MLSKQGSVVVRQGSVKKSFVERRQNETALRFVDGSFQPFPSSKLRVLLHAQAPVLRKCLS
jgi:hypothetical protein